MRIIGCNDKKPVRRHREREPGDIDVTQPDHPGQPDPDDADLCRHLLVVIGVGVGSLKLSNDALQHMFNDDTQTLTALKTSSERLLQARVAMGSYQALYGLGEPEPALLEGARRDIKASGEQFAVYLAHMSEDSQEKSQAMQLQGKRGKLLKDALQPAFEALVNNYFIAFKTLQGKDTTVLSSDYEAALTSLEATLAAREASRYDLAQRRFMLMLEGLGGVGVAVLVIGILARRALIAAIVKPVSHAIDHFKRIAAVEAARAGSTIAEVVQAVQQVAQIMSEISTAAGEQSRGIEQVNLAVTQMDASTQQNAALVEQAAAAAHSLESQADTLRRAVEVFLLAPLQAI